MIGRDPDQTSRFCGISISCFCWSRVFGCSLLYSIQSMAWQATFDVITSWPFMRPPWKTGRKSLYTLVPFWSWNTLQHYLVDVMMKQTQLQKGTNAWRLFPPVFRGGRMKRQDVMTSNVACHAMLWTENSNEHPKTRDPGSRPTKTWYRNPTKPAGLIRITTYDSSERLNFFDLWNLLRIWDCRPFSVLKTLTGSPAEKSSKCHKTRFSSLEPSVNQTLDLRSIKHFRIAWLVLIDIW